MKPGARAEVVLARPRVLQHKNCHQEAGAEQASLGLRLSGQKIATQGLELDRGRVMGWVSVVWTEGFGVGGKGEAKVGWTGMEFCR